MNAKVILEKMRKSNSNSTINIWLEDFLIFAKNDKYNYKDIITSIDDWEKLMFDQEYYDLHKSEGSKLYEASTINYIYFYHHNECETPAELTNLRRLALDSSLMTNFFNMNIKNIEETKLPFLGFIEGIVKSCYINNIDSLELMIRFFYIFFNNYNYKDEKLYGPIKTRFYELHESISGAKIINNPDGSLNLNEGFKNKLTPEELKCVEKNIRPHEIPTTEEYYEVMNCLSRFPKKDYHKILWSYKDYIIVKSKKNIAYLINKDTGDVLKFFNFEIPINKMISESLSILR